MTTPNQRSLTSLGALLFKEHFSAFRDSCYPAHQTALLDTDLRRIAAENGLRDIAIHYSEAGRMPLTAAVSSAASRLFPRACSDNVLLIARTADLIGGMMRICWLSVSDQLGGSEMALESMIRAVRAARPDWVNQVILPGTARYANGWRLPGVVYRRPDAISAGPRGGVGRRASALEHRISARARPATGRKRGGAACLRITDRTRTLAVPAGHHSYQRAQGARPRRARGTPWHRGRVAPARVRVAPRPLTRWLMRRYVRACDAIVANSASVASDVSAMFEQTALVHVVRNAVDLGYWFARTGLRRTSMTCRDSRRLPTYCRSRRPGRDVCAMEGARCVSRRARAHLSSAHAVRGYIIGGPLYDTSGSQYTRADLQAMIESRQLGDHVGLTGFVEPAAAMRALDVVVHASTQPEPFGLAIAEAMACGRAVMTTGHGGAAEFVEDGRNALIARAGDMRALANAVERLVIDVPLRKDLGNQAHETALARFSPDRMALHLAQVFEAIDQPAIAHSA